jgi:hypothetical protein
MGTWVMINEQLHAKDLSFSDMMRIKRLSRNRHIDAVYSATPQELDVAADRAKAILRGNYGPVRPKRFSALDEN